MGKVDLENNLKNLNFDTEEKKNVTILFAGDSGDGIQLTGTQFTDTAALYGNDISTFPNYPAEIRAPQGTEAGVSGFQLHFGSSPIFTPGDACDVLVVMNAAALKSNLDKLKNGGFIIANSSGFDKKNLKLAKYPDEYTPLEDKEISENYRLHSIDITKLTRESLADFEMGAKDKDRCKNMFVLGFIYWLYSRELDNSIRFLEEKFRKKKPEIADANIKVLKSGYNYGETTETFTTRFEVKPASLPKGSYRNIMGNQALALGLIAASKKANVDIFLGTYPITPASDILHELSKHKNFGVKTFQAEDEIAAVCSAIGASFGGSIGVTTSSGPGIALKGEAIGLAVSLEIPLVVINVQRGGPSTGLPTKTEQADLLQAFYGRNGECPLPIIAAYSPSDCFNMAFEAVRIAIEHMTPVMYLTDGYIANGAEPWRYPVSADLNEIKPKIAPEKRSNEEDGEAFLAYKRDENLVRQWALPGTKGLQHRIGGLEKDHLTGNVSYDPENHQIMTDLRAQKVANISKFIPHQKLDNGKDKGDLLILGWGSTYGAIKTAVRDMIEEGYSVAHAQLKYINPFPENLETILRSYKKVLIPEINKGQLIKIIRSEFLIDAKGLNKVKGLPFTAAEIKQKSIELLS